MIEFLSDLVIGFILLYFFREALGYFNDRKNRMYRKRLRNVYELLETGNNKKVIQEVDKLISETNAPASQKSKKKSNQNTQYSSEPGYDEEITIVISKALKSLALVRTGRRAEGDIIIDKLMEINTTDENVLNVVMQYCKETHQAAKIATFYENAVKKFEENTKMIGTPDHEEILTTLFYSYVRLRDFNKQQQIALKLYKMTNKMMYCFWNATSYVMMAQEDSSLNKKLLPQQQQQKGMYLVLAEKILQKAYKEKKMEYNGEFLLYLNILENKTKFDESLEIVNEFNEKEYSSNIGQIDFKIRKKLIYFEKMKKWTALRFLCEQFIENESNANIDDWLVYLTYINCLVEIYKMETDKELKENLVKETLIFFGKLIDRVENKNETNLPPKAQSPYLGRLEFLNKLINSQVESNKFASSYIDNIKKFFVDYLNQFVAKPGFYFDFIFFQKFVTQLKLEDFIIENLKKHHDKSHPFKDIKSIYASISYWQIHRKLGYQKNLSYEESVNLAIKLETLYTEALEFGKNLLPTSMQYADEFLIQAAHIRYELNKSNPLKEDENNILRIVANLKLGLSNSPSNYQFKLLLLNIYSQLGAYNSIQNMYKSMEIKNIQNYSTANLLLIHNIRLGSIVSSINTYTTIGHFFLSNLFDMSNFLVHCYKYGSFLKAIEIFSFINTIRRSLTLNMCLTNFTTISFIMQSTNLSPLQPNAAMSSNDNKEPSEVEDELLDFRSLHATITNHLKEISTVSSVYDLKTGLLPNNIDELNDLLLDHNDKNVLYNWEPNEDYEIGQTQYESIIAEQRSLLKLRNLMIRYVDAFLKLNLSGSLSGKEETLETSLIFYKINLIKTLSEMKPTDGLNEEKSDSLLKIHVSKSFYLERFSQLGLDKLITTFLNLTSELSVSSVLAFFTKEKDSNQNLLIGYKDELKLFLKTIQLKINKAVEIFNEDGKFKIEYVAKILEYFSSSLEALSFIIVLFTMSLSNGILKPIWTEKVKKSKKKKGQYVDNAASVDRLFDIYELLCQTVYFFNLHLDKNICSKILSLTQEACVNKTSTIQGQSTSSYLTDIGQSFSKSFDEMKNIYSAKLKYLLKFSEKMNVQLETSLENLKIE